MSCASVLWNRVTSKTSKKYKTTVWFRRRDNEIVEGVDPIIGYVCEK